MKTLLSLLLIITCTFAFSKEIVITRQGGKPCKADKTQSCYDYAYIKDTEERTTLKCTGKGIEQCPKIGYVVIGQHQMDVDPIIVNVEYEIVNGNLSGNGTVVNGNTVLANYSWVGMLNEYDIIEYNITITTNE